MLTFAPETHTYRWEGNVVPGVTSIIGTWLRLDRFGVYVNAITGDTIGIEKMENASFVGKEIHAAAALILKDALDWDVLDAALVQPLRWFETWMKTNSEARDGLIERPLYSRKYGYAGTADLIYPRKKSIIIVDYKTGAHGAVAPQLAAYEQAYREEFNYRGKVELYCLTLPKDGSEYHFREIRDSRAWPVFLSCLNRYRYFN